MTVNWDGYEVLSDYVGKRITEFDHIPGERKVELRLLAREIRQEILNLYSAALVFICTHNSRRSHMAHLWARLAAFYYQVEGVSCYSGGTEATAFNPSAVKALTDAGMDISRLDESSNPVYLARFPGAADGIEAYSKRFSDPPNPASGFFAVMTCSDADEACPIVFGALARYAITYEDPKAYDGTAEASSRYSERSRQIAREMFYLFSEV